MNILFVCTGNTCRSSMAEGLLKDMIKKNKIDGIQVSSAGISAIEGQKANEKAIMVLRNKGIDISSHRSTQLTKKLIKEADLILTMTLAHAQIIEAISPEATGKVYTLRGYARKMIDDKNYSGNFDIADPYGMGYNTYKSSMSEIESELKIIINNIDKLRRKK